MISYKKISYLLLMIFIFYRSIEGLSVGSTTTPSRQSNVIFPVSDTDNKINSFAFMEGGFSLASVTTTCTFDSVCSVSGTMNLNGGSLYLTKDLVTSNSFTWGTGGTIFGNGYAFYSPKYTQTWLMPMVGTSLQLRDILVSMESEIQLNESITFFGVSKIQGNGYKLIIPSGFNIVINDGASLLFENVILDIRKSNPIVCVTNNASCIFKNTILKLSADVEFQTGSFEIQNNVKISGTSKFSYSSTKTSTIASNALLFLDYGVTFSYSPNLASKNLLFMQDQSSYLYLNGCTLYSTITGLRLDTGTVFIDNNVTMTSEGRNSGEAAEIGGNLNMFVLSEAVLNMFGNFKYV